MAGDDRQHHSFGPCEAIICDENGLAVFELIRRQGAPASAVHCAFDLLELDGKDLRREPIEKRKALLAKLLRAGLSYWKRTHNSKAAGDTKTDGFACSLAPLPHWFAPTRTGKAIKQRAEVALSFVGRRQKQWREKERRFYGADSRCLLVPIPVAMMIVARIVGIVVVIVAMMIAVVAMMIIVMMIAVPRSGRHCAGGRDYANNTQRCNDLP